MYVTVPSFFEMVPERHALLLRRSFTYTITPSLKSHGWECWSWRSSVAHVFLNLSGDMWMRGKSKWDLRQQFISNSYGKFLLEHEWWFCISRYLGLKQLLVDFCRACFSLWTDLSACPLDLGWYGVEVWHTLFFDKNSLNSALTKVHHYVTQSLLVIHELRR